jgi:hypothetical protein
MTTTTDTTEAGMTDELQPVDRMTATEMNETMKAARAIADRLRHLPADHAARALACASDLINVPRQKMREAVATLCPRAAPSPGATPEGVFRPTPHEPVDGITLFEWGDKTLDVGLYVVVDGRLTGWLDQDKGVASFRYDTGLRCELPDQSHPAKRQWSLGWVDELTAFRDRIRVERAARSRAAAPKAEEADPFAAIDGLRDGLVRDGVISAAAPVPPAGESVLEYVPWDFNTMPVAVKVRHRQAKTVHVAIPENGASVFLLRDGSVIYFDLQHYYQQLDGTPCGIARETTRTP